MIKKRFRKSALTKASWEARATKQSATKLTGDYKDFHPLSLSPIRHFATSLLRPLTFFHKHVKVHKKGEG